MPIAQTSTRYLKLIAASTGPGPKARAALAAFFHTILRLRTHPISKIVELRVNDHSFELDLGRMELASVLEVLLERSYELDDGWAAKDGDVIVDAGANVGVYAIVQAKRAPSSTVYAFEPSPTTYPRLVRNIALNSLENVKPYACALGDTSGTAPFLDKAVSLNSRISSSNLGESIARVAVTTLDEFMRAKALTHINLLKIDTEGYERPVLAGGVAALEKTHRIVLETHSACDEGPIREQLEEAGFRWLHREHDIWFFARPGRWAGDRAS